MATDEHLIITGDFNIHVHINNPFDVDGLNLLDLFSSMNLTQHVQFPSHVSQNTLDLVVTRSFDGCKVYNIQPDYLISDHINSAFQLGHAKGETRKQNHPVQVNERN